MAADGHERVWIDPGTGAISVPDTALSLPAIAPVIISASRSTDIPAFYGDWFFERLHRGYVTWTNPFNGKVQHVSFARARVLVFWSKNPLPFLPVLESLSREGWQILFLFTLNDYTREELEPGVPPLDERIRTFSRVSSVLGRGRLTWRFDPILLSDNLTVDEVLERIAMIGDRVHRDASRLIFSFVDIGKYRRVRKNLASGGSCRVREPTADEELAIARGISSLNEDWGLEVLVCGEERDFSRFSIGRGACISRDVLAREFPGDRALMDRLIPGSAGKRLKDPGQRKHCGCVPSKDIGCYSTCMHLCRYCYANSSASRVRKNYAGYLWNQDAGIYPPSITGDQRGSFEDLGNPTTLSPKPLSRSGEKNLTNKLETFRTLIGAGGQE
jgi:hypothetical protein